jgi:hypothetical protein
MIILQGVKNEMGWEVLSKPARVLKEPPFIAFYSRQKSIDLADTCCDIAHQWAVSNEQ